MLSRQSLSDLMEPLGLAPPGKLSDLMKLLGLAPPRQLSDLLRDMKASYGAHYDRVLSELEGARLDPTTLALAKRLDDPLAARRIGAVQGKTRAALTEGLDPGEVETVTQAARAAVPGALAPAAERLALDRYRQSGDGDDAVTLARETLGVAGDTALAGDDGDDDVAEDGEPSENRAQDLRDAAQATVTPEALDRAVEDIESAPERIRSGEQAFPSDAEGDVRIGDNRLDPETAALLGEALTLQPDEVEAFVERLGPLRVSGQLTGQQLTALIEVARRSGDGGFLDPSLSQSRKRSRSGGLLRALDQRMVERQRFTEIMSRIAEGGILGTPKMRTPRISAATGGAGGPTGRKKRQRKPTPTAEEVAALPAGPGWKPDRRFISGEVFVKLPPKGKIDPQSVRTSQQGFSKDFKPEKPFGRRSIDEMVAEIRADPSKVDRIRPIRLVASGGHVYTVDHRRLIAFRRLEIEIPYVHVSRESLNKRERARIDSAPLFNDNGAFIWNRHANTKE